jgi:hypothetical protein
MPGQYATVSVTAGVTIRSDLRARGRRRYVLVAAPIDGYRVHRSLAARSTCERGLA